MATLSKLRLMITGPNMSQAPFAEYDDLTHRWRIWQAFSSDVKSGTYLDMYDTGLVERVTLLNGVVQNITRISNPRLQEL